VAKDSRMENFRNYLSLGGETAFKTKIKQPVQSPHYLGGFK